MHLNKLPRPKRRDKFELAFTLFEVVFCILIAGLIFGGIITAYVQSSRYAEWSGYSLAATALSVQQLEQAKSAKWDTQVTPNVDEITNLNLQARSYVNGAIQGYTNEILDMPISGNGVLATNYVTIKAISISTNPPASIKLVMVQSVYPFRGDYYTNTIATYMGPDR